MAMAARTSFARSPRTKGVKPQAKTPFVLGYLIEQSPKMAYKLRFRPLEALGAQGWQTVETSA